MRRNEYDEIETRHRKKRKLSSGFFYLIMVLASILFLYTFYQMPMFPLKWTVMAGAALGVVLLITGFFTVKLRPTNFFQKSVNIVLAVVLFAASILLPYEESKITALFESVTGSTVIINVYAMSDDYKSAHPEYFSDDNTIWTDGYNGKQILKDYSDYLIYGTVVKIDRENQNYCISQLNSMCHTTVKTMDHESLDSAVKDLYNNTTDVLIMSDTYARVIEDTPGYELFQSDTVILDTFERKIESSFSFTVGSDFSDKPFIIFFGGNDQTGSLSLQGRTDVDMVVAVNPSSGQIAIINLPRDSYIPNPDYSGAYDKLTHLGITGLDNTLEGLSNILGQSIENYVLVNFDTFQTIIDSLGGITIDNPYAFTAIDGQHFVEGTISLNSVQALMYVRERYNLPGGDFDRNMHQQIVMQGIIRKITSPEGIIHFNEILDRVKDCILTNVSSKSIYSLVSKQLDEDIDWNIVKYHVEGEMGMEECASAPGQLLSVVYPYDSQITFVSDVIDAVYAGEILTQQDLPEGSFQ